MTNTDLLGRLNNTHQWTSEAILNLRELVKNEDNFTVQAINDMRAEILRNVQLTISEMEILALELEA